MGRFFGFTLAAFIAGGNAQGGANPRQGGWIGKGFSGFNPAKIPGGGGSSNPWTLRTIPPTIQGGNTPSVIYANGQFLMLVNNPGASASCATSSDGITWTNHSMGTAVNSTLGAIAFGAGLYVATVLNPGTAADRGVVYTSVDGSTWTKRTAQAGASANWACSSIAYNGTVFSMFNFFNTPIAPNSPLYTSPDGITWAGQPLPNFGLSNGGAQQSLIYDGTNFVYVGQDSTLAPIESVSSDGINWNNHSLTFFAAGGAVPAGVLLGNSEYFAFGTADSGTNLAEVEKSASSTWVGTSVNTQLPAGNNALAMAYGNGKYVIIDNSTDYSSSPDGTIWTAGVDLSSQILGWEGAMAFGNGIFVAPVLTNTNKLAIYTRS